MKKTLSIVALLAAATLSAQMRWDYELGIRTPPPQGGMFGGAFLLSGARESKSPEGPWREGIGPLRI